MKPIAKIDCRINDKFYAKGDEIEVQTKEQIIKLNELGYIEPLSMKDIQNFGKEVKPRFENKKIKKEETKWQI